MAYTKVSQPQPDQEVYLDPEDGDVSAKVMGNIIIVEFKDSSGMSTFNRVPLTFASKICAVIEAVQSDLQSDPS